eukprot:Em0009g133a
MTTPTSDGCGSAPLAYHLDSWCTENEFSDHLLPSSFTFMKVAGSIDLYGPCEASRNLSHAGSIDDGTCEDYFQQLYLLDGRQVTTLRSLQELVQRPLSVSLSLVTAYQHGFKIIPVIQGLHAGSIDDGTCEDYFQQLYLLDGRQVTTLRSLPELVACRHAGSIDDGTCEDYFQQLYLLDGRQVTTLRSLPGVGRMQVPLMMEPAKTTSSNYLTRWCRFIDDGTCEDYFQQLYLLDGRQVTTLRSLPGVGCRQVPLMMEPAKTTSSNYIYLMDAGSIDDGTCEDYFQQLCIAKYSLPT